MNILEKPKKCFMNRCIFSIGIKAIISRCKLISQKTGKNSSQNCLYLFMAILCEFFKQFLKIRIDYFYCKNWSIVMTVNKNATYKFLFMYLLYREHDLCFLIPMMIYYFLNRSQKQIDSFQ